MELGVSGQSVRILQASPSSCRVSNLSGSTLDYSPKTLFVTSRSLALPSCVTGLIIFPWFHIVSTCSPKPLCLNSLRLPLSCTTVLRPVDHPSWFPRPWPSQSFRCLIRLFAFFLLVSDLLFASFRRDFDFEIALKSASAIDPSLLLSHVSSPGLT